VVVLAAGRAGRAVSGVPWPAVLTLAAALVVWSPRDAVAGRRARALHRRSPEPPAVVRSAGGITADVRRWAFAGTVGLAVWLLVGGTTGLVCGAVAVVAGERLLRRAAPDPGAEARAARIRELPAACDLLAVLLAAGVPVSGALAAVGEAVPAPLGPALGHVAALYRLGAEPRRSWADVPPELGALGRVLVRAGESGSSVAPALHALAADSRATARAATETAVRRAGVWVLAPLGVCFLPAFLCLGVVPLVLGIAGEVFG
jgi:Flp pilus assembly protein TadB